MNKDKLNFNFDFLGKSTSEEAEDIEKSKKAINEIFNKFDFTENNLNNINAYKADMLISNLKCFNKDLKSNVLHNAMAIDLLNIAEKIAKKYQKYIEASKLLHFANEIVQNDNVKSKINKLIVKIENKKNKSKQTNINSEHTPISTNFLNKITNDSDNITVIIISIVIIIFLIFIIICCSNKINNDRKNKEIEQLKNSAYIYLKNDDILNYQNTLSILDKYNVNIVDTDYKIRESINTEKRNIEIDKLKSDAYTYYKNNNMKNYNATLKKLESYKKYGVHVEDIESTIKRRFDSEKESVVSDLASIYENDKNRFYELKKTYLPTYFRNNVNEFNASVDDKLGYKELSYTKKPLPRSGLIKNYTGRKRIAPFKVSSASNEHNFLKFYDSKSNKLALTAFVRAGETVEFDVPIGNYYIKTASGSVWYNDNDYFGEKTTYSMANAYFDFYVSGNRAVGHTLKLYNVANGNLESEDISAEDF